MAKTCEVCGNKIGTFDDSYNLKDGLLCENCFQNLFHVKVYNQKQYQDAVNKLKTMTASTLLGWHRNLINEKEENMRNEAAFKKEQEKLSSVFTTSKIVDCYLEIDNKNNLIKINQNHIYRKSDLISYQVYENGANIAEGGVGRALVGGFLFGDVGAIVGAQTRKHKDLCTDMQIVITFNNEFNNVEKIKLINSEVSKNEHEYKTACNKAREIIAQLDVISHENEKQSYKKSTKSTTSVADEIFKIKQLLDDGAINQEEYDKLKEKIISSL